LDRGERPLIYEKLGANICNTLSQGHETPLSVGAGVSIRT